ncbi:hypothetical protein FHL15_000352 [Xylaria flabelliformis]|uniref:Tryptophan synthase beta chain-like PALP domain-containing protein n=1 Tax=Xylaria flabelliformis TaxID=2512241 RepID=A0A553IFP0_9PEZI|nr:hypothetical protein FHL15_000352 [Xylaria flabelliformis]
MSELSEWLGSIDLSRAKYTSQGLTSLRTLITAFLSNARTGFVITKWQKAGRVLSRLCRAQQAFDTPQPYIGHFVVIVIRIDGEYEASVNRAKEDARMNGWHFVSSISWTDSDHGIPQDVMNSYMVVVEEALGMLPSLTDITHVFVCGGVGSIAAAVFLGFYERFCEIQAEGTSAKFPRCVVVEPTEADCLFQSEKARDGTLRTLMAGHASLADGKYDDVPVVCGESSATNMGVLLKAGGDSTLRDRLGLSEHSQRVIFGSPEDAFKAQDDFLHLRE